MVNNIQQMNAINNAYEILENLYENYRCGDLGAQKVYNHNKCVTTRYIKNSLRDESEFLRNLKRLNKMISINDERDVELLIEVKDLFLMYYDNMNRFFYLQNKIPRNTKNSIVSIIDEFDRYHRFCENQNHFDNILSIIKICDRMKYYKKDLILNGEFDTTDIDDTFYDIERDLKEQFLKELRPIRFTL